MAFVCASFVLVCAENFFVCASLEQVIQKTNFQGHWAAGEIKIQNGPIEPKMVSIVCASLVLQFFLFVLLPFSNWGPKHPYVG